MKGNDDKLKAAKEHNTKRKRLTAYRKGWMDGAVCEPISEPPEFEDFVVGWEDGRAAFRKAMDEKRTEFGLKAASKVQLCGPKSLNCSECGETLLSASEQIAQMCKKCAFDKREDEGATNCSECGMPMIGHSASGGMCDPCRNKARFEGED